MAFSIAVLEDRGLIDVERPVSHYVPEKTLTIFVPGASMTATASILALFCEMLLAGGTTADGTRLVRSSTLERYLTANVAGFDRMLRSVLVLGRGFPLGRLGAHPYGWWDSRACVGHGGGLSGCAAQVCSPQQRHQECGNRRIPVMRGAT